MPYFGETLERTGQTGPQQREMRKAFRLAKQVEVGSQQIGFRKESHRTKQVGVLRRHPKKVKPCNTKYCENREQQQDIF